MVPPPAGGGFGAAALPAGLANQGMYIIFNNSTNNRYAGISTNLASRFNTRMAVVTELGFSQAVMNQIAVFWGGATTTNTALPAPAPAPAPVPVPAYGAPLTRPIDGQAVNLERLLIRFLLTQFVGGTVSNNMMAFGAYANPTANNVTVTLNWGAVGGIPAGNHTAVWPAGGPGW